MVRKVYITGANGFIGQHLVNCLCEKGYEVYALIRKGTIPGFDLKENVKVVIGDMLDYDSLKRTIPEGSVVVNLAVNGYHPILSFKVNVGGVENLVRAAKKKRIERIIHFSSQATKIKEKGVYSKSKLMSEEVVKKSGLRYVIVKPSLVYGEGERGLFNKIKILVEKLPFVPVFGDGKTKVNPVYVRDLCKYVDLIIKNQKDSGSVYDIGCTKPVTYNDIYRGIISSFDKKVPLVHIPVWIGLMAGKFFEWMRFKNPPFFIDNVLGSTQEIDCNSKLIIKKYGFRPMVFSEGVKAVFFKNKIRVAVVGLGKMGVFHLSILSTFDDVEIAALIDSNPKLFKTVKSMGIRGNFYTSLDEALEREKIGALFVLTPTFTHFNYLKKAFERNINVFVEKPVVVNREELKKIKVIKEKFKGVASVGYTLLHTRIYNEIKNILSSARYGRVKSFRASFKHGEVFGEKRGWMFEKKKSGGGVLMNPGPHLFSLINWFFGQPKRISSQVRKIYSVEVDDEAKVSLDYGGFCGEVFLSWSVRNQNLSKIEIKVELEKAILETDGKVLTINSRGKKITKRSSDLPSLLDGLAFDINPEANGEAYCVEDRFFMDAILKKRKLLSGLDLALDTETTIHKVYDQKE